MNNFESLGLSRGLVEVVKALGFENPTPIQEKAIPELLTGERDFVGLAQTGTGKTAAFGLPLMQLVDAERLETQALVLAPTRELCLQITSDLEKFSKGYKSLNIVAVYGGASITDQMRKLKKGAQIVVATPGRLIDLTSRKYVKLESVDIVVLDEADEMLNMGFKESIDAILAFTPEEKITWLFSATMPPAVREIASNYMTDPFELSVSQKTRGNENIEHHYVLVKESDKYSALKRILDLHPDIFGLVFCRTKLDTQDVAEQLMRDGYNADSLHGDLTQAQRDRVMGKFRDRTLQILVATDVAARGIDVSDISHVIHMNLPDELENYTHRSGRTARAGKTGDSILLITKKELPRLGQLERFLKNNFSPMKVPSGMEICRKQVLHFMHELKNGQQEVSNELDALMPEIMEELSELSREEIIKRVTANEFSRMLNYYRNAVDYNQPGGTPGKKDQSDYATEGNFVRFFINLGRKDGLDKGSMLRVICDAGEVKKKYIGRIDLNSTYSHFDVLEEVADAIRDGFKGTSFQGRSIRVDRADGKRPDNSKKKFHKKKDKKRKGSVAW